ncbi:glycosyltransferase [Microbacterium sp. ARD31]|uniref:glycosyltransferase n=1 Tax=Microbacterium sp. ARD31 TaxID=2962576 RepID=UPI0028823323|nr:glycosyltransferase [Microbacterium sp. ARD31]MDT0186482.1 glycosyltransferase [Microbacterium sp. ARD31]
MRALAISHSASVDEWRGRERALQHLGLDIETLCAQKWTEGGAMVTPHAQPGERVTGVRTVGTHPALFVYDPRPLWRALRRNPDVIDIHEEPFALATAEVLALRWLSGCRAPYVLYTAQNLDKRYPTPFRQLERWALRHASGISACNSEAARIVERKGFPGQARVIPLGIDPSRFTPSPARPPGPTITVGYIGRLVEEKGVLVLVHALALDERLHARMAGGGPLADRVRDEAVRRGVRARVELVGALDPSEVVAFYREIDVLAVPSIPRAGWTEQFGRVAIEAMACGVPVVSSDAGALPEVVGDAGLLVPHGDAAALAYALAHAATGSAQRLRERGIARAAECTWDAVALHYLDLYRSAARVDSADASRPVEIIVVAYGAQDLLRAALEAVETLPVTVVDNSSSAEIRALCEDRGAVYIDPGRNAGFAAGVNIGLRHRQRPGADVLLLNPDAVVSPSQIHDLQAALHADPRLASIAPEQKDRAGRAARVEWPFPSPVNAWLEAVGLGRFEGGGSFVIGSVLLLRAEALAHVGGFDEHFFLYAEETDWAYRARRLGWRHAVASGVWAVHEGGATSTDSRSREARFHASQERYFRKHFGARGWQVARSAVWVGSMVRAALLRGERRDEARRRAALYRLGPIRVEARIAPRA